MATYVQRALSIIEAAVGTVPPGDQLQRIADAYLNYAPDIAAEVIADPENPTNEEKAEVFVLAMRRWGQSVLRATAEKAARAAHDGEVEAAGDTAAGDL